MAGLLTDSHLEASRSLEPVAIVLFQDVLRSFTAAGLSGIYTRFPFNPHTRMVYAEPIRGKDSIFYLTIHFSQAGIYGIHGSQVKFRTISSQEKLMHKALKINIKKTG